HIPYLAAVHGRVGPCLRGRPAESRSDRLWASRCRRAHRPPVDAARYIPAGGTPAGEWRPAAPGASRGPRRRAFALRHLDLARAASPPIRRRLAIPAGALAGPHGATLIRAMRNAVGAVAVGMQCGLLAASAGAQPPDARATILLATAAVAHDSAGPLVARWSRDSTRSRSGRLATL